MSFGPEQAPAPSAVCTGHGALPGRENTGNSVLAESNTVLKRFLSLSHQATELEKSGTILNARLTIHISSSSHFESNPNYADNSQLYFRQGL